MNLPLVTIEYIRPGKDVSHYQEDLVIQDAEHIKTTKHLPPAIAERLTNSLHRDGFISPQQRCEYINKVYFFHEYFNLLQFQDEHQKTLGYYSDIGTPLMPTAKGYQMTDWFLDIWMFPDGRLVELDMDEFEEALAHHLISESEAEIARATFTRLIEEARQGIYPTQYLK